MPSCTKAVKSTLLNGTRTVIHDTRASAYPFKVTKKLSTSHQQWRIMIDDQQTLL